MTTQHHSPKEQHSVWEPGTARPPFRAATVWKNYGTVGEYSEFFDQAQRIVSSAEDPAVRNFLCDTLANRGQITAGSGKTDMRLHFQKYG